MPLKVSMRIFIQVKAVSRNKYQGNRTDNKK